MASKRYRENDSEKEEMREIEEELELKRQKSLNQIVSILDEEEEEPHQDLSSIITSLQQEISSPSPEPKTRSQKEEEEEEEERERVMRHLLEASDDELGIIPKVEEEEEEASVGFSLCDIALWEFEDYEAANYFNHTLFQSHLFI